MCLPFIFLRELGDIDVVPVPPRLGPPHIELCREWLRKRRPRGSKFFLLVRLGPNRNWP